MRRSSHPRGCVTSTQRATLLPFRRIQAIAQFDGMAVPVLALRRVHDAHASTEERLRQDERRTGDARA